MQLNVRIRTARLRANLTQAQLARQIGVTRTAVVNWESGTNPARPTGKRLEKICRLTEVSWEWLATGRGQAKLSPDTIPAVDAELVDDLIERRLLQAFRGRDVQTRQAVLTLLEAGSPRSR